MEFDGLFSSRTGVKLELEGMRVVVCSLSSGSRALGHLRLQAGPAFLVCYNR